MSAGGEKVLSPSILDRLIDDSPDSQREAVLPPSQRMSQLMSSVRRDLEWLLNTRRVCELLEPSLKELQKSVLSYGLPDVAASDIGSTAARQQFISDVERTIRIYEPRFKNVRVRLVEDEERLDRTMRFRVDALLRVEPVAEKVVFDSQVDPNSGAFSVKNNPT